MQHVALRATWYEGTALLLNLTEFEIAFILAFFIGWTIKPMKEGRKPEYPEKNPDDELPENATCLSARIQAPSETGTRTMALVAGLGKQTC